jgi:predicted acyltransferase
LRQRIARAGLSGTVSTTTKANLKADLTAKVIRKTPMRNRWSLGIAGLMLILAGGFLS